MQALFLFPEDFNRPGQKYLFPPRGKCVTFSASRGWKTVIPPLTHSPQDTLTYWEEDISAYRMHSSSPSNANINAETGVIVFPSR